MDYLLVLEMLGLGLVSLAGWWWSMEKVQDLRLELRFEKAKVQDLRMQLAQAKAKDLE
jgi:hypothetical protein